MQAAWVLLTWLQLASAGGSVTPHTISKTCNFTVHFYWHPCVAANLKNGTQYQFVG